MNWLRDVVRGIKNLVAYAPLIWCDRDWDFAYLLALMEFKMRRMANSIGNSGITEDSRHAATTLIEAADTCQRLYEDEYGVAEHGALDVKYGVEYLDMEGHFGREGSDEERVERHAVHTKAMDDQFKDLDRLAELFGTELLGWWD